MYPKESKDATEILFPAGRPPLRSPVDRDDFRYTVAEKRGIFAVEKMNERPVFVVDCCEMAKTSLRPGCNLL
jgi:hypothetical protein